MEKQPGVLERNYTWQTKLTKNQYKQESTKKYQGHWLDVQLVPMCFQIQDIQTTLQGIKSAHGEHTKLRCFQLHTQANNYQLLKR